MVSVHPFPNIAPSLCALLCEKKQMDTFLEFECAKRLRAHRLSLCVSCPASGCRSGGSHLEKFARGSNLALVLEAVQSRPMTTFPESWHDYSEQYFGSLSRRMCVRDSPKWRYRQNCYENKSHVLIREAFLGRTLASSGPRYG